MALLQHIRLNVIQHSVAHWARDILFDKNALEKRIISDLAISNFDLLRYKQSRIILSFLGEGQCAWDLHAVVRLFNITHGKNNFAILTGALPPDGISDPPVYCFTNHMVNHGDFLVNIKKHPANVATEIDRKFLCLIRRASQSRAFFASELRQRLSSHDIRMSFGSHHHDYELRDYQPLFGEDSLPILLDGTIDTSNIGKIYDVQDTWYQSLFNIVVETSSQQDHGSYRSIFITEKTFKSFAMCQIPIWFAVPGLVNQVRLLGFDMFDDIIDHSYDRIQSQANRMQQVLGQITKINEAFTLEQCAQQRILLWPRLMHNYNLLFDIEQQHHEQINYLVHQFVTQKLE